MPVISSEQLKQTVALAADILSRGSKPGTKVRSLPADLEARRLQLLAQNLGFNPQPPLPVLHVVGDSHAAFFAGAEELRFHQGRRIFTGFFRLRHVSAFTELLPVFRVFHTGASTAWSADFHGSESRTREKLDVLLRKDIPPGARVLLVFGEIDCRWHIPKAVQGGSRIAAATARTVERFIAVPRRLARAGYDVTVWQPSGVTVGEPTAPETNNPLPTSGSQQLRLEITREYCDQLAAACQREKIRCTGIVGKYHSWQETAAPECFLDGCHLSQRMMPLALRTLMESGALPLKPANEGVCHLAG